MKDFGYTASCLKNTNRVISSTETNWAAVRNGSFLLFNSDSEFYSVGSSKEIKIIKDFSTLSPQVLSISGYCCPLFLNNDNVEVSFKEFEVDDILGIFSSGIGYTQGDILTLNGGTPYFDISSNATEPATFKVILVDERGSITHIEAENRGCYIEPPHQTSTLKGGTGKNAGLNLSYKVSDTRRIIDRVIEEVTYHPEQTLLKLNYPLDSTIKKGKIVLNKWELLLTSNYIGENKLNSSYKILRDYTPHLGLPLISQNSPSFEKLYNKSSQILDLRIKNIEDKLSKLGL